MIGKVFQFPIDWQSIQVVKRHGGVFCLCSCQCDGDDDDDDDGGDDGDDDDDDDEFRPRIFPPSKLFPIQRY